MSGFRQPEQSREQIVLWAHRLDDAIPLDHPVRHFDYLLRSEAFAETFTEWQRRYVLVEGKPPYPPRYLAGLYLYGMMNRIRSSRQLEAACYNRLDVIWLMDGQHPDHSTIAGFVKAHREPLRALFRDTVRVGIRAKLIALDHISVDGTKIEADAGRKSVRSEAKIASWLAHVDDKIAALEAEWTKNESQEASLFGETTPWKPPKASSPAQQVAALKQQQARLTQALKEIERRRDQAGAGPPPKAIASTTDPDSRSMKDKEGRGKPNFNGQLAVDEQTSMIVGSEVNDAPDDSGQLTPMVEQTTETCGQAPEAVSADSAYNTGPELAAMEERGITSYLPESGENSKGKAASKETRQAVEAVRQGKTLTEAQWAVLPRDRTGRLSKTAFVYDASANTYRCPAGETLFHIGTTRDTKGWGVRQRDRYGHCSACATCPYASSCSMNMNPAKGRTITRDQYEEHRERQRVRMASDAGRQCYRRRRETVEPRIGEIKHVYGVRRFLRRGLDAVRTEWSMVCTAVNLGILLRHWEEVARVL